MANGPLIEPVTGAVSRRMAQYLPIGWHISDGMCVDGNQQIL
jgi:hypothetical protein